MWFPQLSSGTAAQLPLRRVRRWRDIENRLESGERIVLPDSGTRAIEWSMTWHDLSDSEMAGLQALYQACRGSYGSFTFVDPLENLLGWSEDLGRPDWERGLLGCTKGAVDPFGRENAWVISNPSAGVQAISQTIGLPGTHVACFSAWIRADATQAVALGRDGAGKLFSAAGSWKRAFISGGGAGQSATFRLEVQPGGLIEIYGLQAEAQPYPSQYKPTRAACGIYPETRFATDELEFRSTGPALTSCEIALVSRV